MTSKIALLCIVALAPLLLRPTSASAIEPKDMRYPLPIVKRFTPLVAAFWRRELGPKWQPLVRWRIYNSRGRRNFWTACGHTKRLPENAFYCQWDYSIYYDKSLLRFLINNRGDWAVAGTTVAHEYGHHIQWITGITQRARRNRQFAHLELNADCYAGVFTRVLHRKGIADRQDVFEGQRDLLASGDRTPPHQPDSHGTGKQRAAWYRAGFETRDIAYCNRIFSKGLAAAAA